MKLNFFEDHKFTRKAVLFWCVGVGGFLWIVFGYDGGIVMLERLLLTGNVSYAWEAYGTSFHFSAMVTYGLLFVFSSRTLEKLGIVKTKNSVYSLLFVCLNIALFELVYMALFNHFQLRRSLLDWLAKDFMFLSQYFAMLMFGVYGLLLFLTEKVKLKSLSLFFGATSALVGAWVAWIFYPYPVTQVTFNGWTSNTLFPQTHYAYVNHNLYVQNWVLHTVNLATKALFALTQLCFIRGFKKRSP